MKTVTNAIDEVYNLDTMTGWELTKLCRELTAESVMYSHNVTNREWLRSQRDAVDAEIRRRMC